MALKYNVKLQGLQPQILLALLIVDKVFRERNFDWTITSVNDSKHGTNSLHYIGQAVDLRTKHLFMSQQRDRASSERRELLEDFVESIAIAVGDNFDVILEGFGTDNEHMHIEYDPVKLAAPQAPITQTQTE